MRTSMNLKAVHNVIQAAMGWLDYHLREFTANERKHGMFIPNDRDWNARITNAATTKLSSLLSSGVREMACRSLPLDWEQVMPCTWRLRWRTVRTWQPWINSSRTQPPQLGFPVLIPLP